MLPTVGGCIEKREENMLTVVMETVETEQRTLYVVRGCGSDGNSREHCMLSETVEVMETAENIVCCQRLCK